MPKSVGTDMDDSLINLIQFLAPEMIFGNGARKMVGRTAIKRYVYVY